MKVMNRFWGFIVVFVCLFGLSKVNAQYNIKVKVHGVSDTTMMIGHHFGTKKYVVDTARIDEKGWATFQSNDKLDKGIYLVVLPSLNMTYFEFLVGDDKEFTLETDTSNYVENMKVKGCRENEVFNFYQRKMAVLNVNRMEMDKLMQAHQNNPDSVEIIRESIKKNAEQRRKIMDDIIADNPDDFFSKVLKSMYEVEVPEPPRDENGNITDSSFQWKYYKEHYFDNIDFGESGLLRTPIFEGKLTYFFSKVVIPVPDSLIKEADMVIEKAYDAGDTLMFRYVAGDLLNYFQASKIMGYDEVFVHVAERWYLSGYAHWADSTFLAKLTERVMKISPNIIGNVAPDLKKMETHDEQFMSLHLVDADYTILVFWEPDCGHCKKEVPKLFELWRDTLDAQNIKVFCLYTQYEKEKWVDFINEKDLVGDGWYNVWDGPYPHSNFRNFYDIYSTPVIYVLDKEKRIVAKRIEVESITDFLEFHRKRIERESGGK
jgi:thiol-disulfide isomerase/thioredoxin